MHHEIISVHLGQGGIQIGNAFWELLCLEHGIKLDGSPSYMPDDENLTSLASIFSQIEPHDKFIPRTIFADLEPTVVDEVRVGVYKDLYGPDSLLSGMEDAAGNFARGYYTLGSKVVGALISSARRATEACDHFQGFLTVSSLGGGTGSGLLSMFQERVAMEFGGKPCMQFSLFPSHKLAAGPIEAYNAVHHLYRSGDFSAINCLLDNAALYEICTDQLSIMRPTYTSVNRVISPLLAGVTASMRFRCQLNAQINEYLTNLVPFPRAHFPMLSFAPFCTNFHSERSMLTSDILTKMVLNRTHRTVSANITDGMSMATCLTYRGDHCIADVAKSVQELRSLSLYTVDWCPTGFKVAYTPQPPVCVPGMGPDKLDRSVVMLTNNTVIAQVFTNVGNTFKNLFSKKAFVHWYVGEGMEEAEFTDAYEALVTLAADLTELGKSDDEPQKVPVFEEAGDVVSVEDEEDDDDDEDENPTESEDSSGETGENSSHARRNKSNNYKNASDISVDSVHNKANKYMQRRHPTRSLAIKKQSSLLQSYFTTSECEKLEQKKSLDQYSNIRLPKPKRNLRNMKNRRSIQENIIEAPLCSSKTSHDRIRSLLQNLDMREKQSNDEHN